MTLIAHVTPLESAAAIAVFLAGACAGAMIAYSMYAWLKYRIR
jgi:hypothetical protein